MKIKYLTIVVLTMLVIVSCSSEFDKYFNSPVVQEKFEGALKFFNAKKYTKSAELFESILLAVKGTPQEDSVQYYLALSNYNAGDIYTAEANFDQFVQVFPKGPFSEKARFYRIDCLYRATHRYELDQIPSYKALSAINEFIYDYPDSEYLVKCKDYMKDLQTRIDKKSFESARLYHKIEDYKAAVFALKNALKDNPDNYYREDIIYYIVTSNYLYALNSVPSKQKERYMSMIDEYYNFISEFPDSKYRKELDQMFEKAQIVTKK